MDLTIAFAPLEHRAMCRVLVRPPVLALDRLGHGEHARRGPEIAIQSLGTAPRDRSRPSRLVSAGPVRQPMRTEILDGDCRARGQPSFRPLYLAR